MTILLLRPRLQVLPHTDCGSCATLLVRFRAGGIFPGSVSYPCKCSCFCFEVGSLSHTSSSLCSQTPIWRVTGWCLLDYGNGIFNESHTVLVIHKLGRCVCILKTTSYSFYIPFYMNHILDYIPTTVSTLCHSKKQVLVNFCGEFEFFRSERFFPTPLLRFGCLAVTYVTCALHDLHGNTNSEYRWCNFVLSLGDLTAFGNFTIFLLECF